MNSDLQTPIDQYPKLVDIIENWLKEDLFLNNHFIIKRSINSVVTSINLSCYHDNNYHSYDQFACWISIDSVESDIGDEMITSFSDRWISINAASPTFFDDLRRLLYEIHHHYNKYCRPKWTHPKK
jgi:hypothetical protein